MGGSVGRDVVAGVEKEERDEVGLMEEIRWSCWVV